MVAIQTKSSDLIQILNDRFRTTFVGGFVVQTDGVSFLPEAEQLRIREKVQAFSVFDKVENDPLGEHDFGLFEYDGFNVIWKIEYYNLDLSAESEDPTDPKRTTRILTIMLASEY